MSSAVNQNKIWEHFQNQDVEAFKENAPRLEFLLKKMRALSRSPKQTILNVGIGNGYFETRALEEGFQVSALDPDHMATEKMKKLGVDAKQGSLVSLPFPDESFDFVVASEVLEHLKPQETTKALEEIRRVLKQDSFFIGSVPFNELLKGNETICPHCSHLFHRWGHEQSFTEDKMMETLSKTLSVDEMKIRSFVRFRGRSFRGKIKSLFKWILGAMGEQVADPHLYFCAKKK